MVVSLSLVLFRDTWYHLRPSSVMYDDSLICFQIAKSDIRPHVKWAVSLVIADDKYSSSGICMCRAYVTIRANISSEKADK